MYHYTCINVCPSNFVQFLTFAKYKVKFYILYNYSLFWTTYFEVLYENNFKIKHKTIYGHFWYMNSQVPLKHTFLFSISSQTHFQHPTGHPITRRSQKKHFLSRSKNKNQSYLKVSISPSKQRIAQRYRITSYRAFNLAEEIYYYSKRTSEK